VVRQRTAQKPDHKQLPIELDEFDLNDYIRSIRFDELKVPTVPFPIPTSKHYFGMEQIRLANWISSSYGALEIQRVGVMCSDMEMEDIAEDVDFGKKWMFAIAMTLKKGCILTDPQPRPPLEELMLGLESWVPIYMTGQVSPYYLRGREAAFTVTWIMSPVRRR
jgi:hypothetical protein